MKSKISVKDKDKTTLELKKGQYLSSLDKEIIKYITNYKRVLLNAQPGTGKTSLIQNLCRHLKLKDSKFKRIIFCAPYIVIQDQLKANLSNKKITVNLEINMNLKGSIDLSIDHKVITSTFEGLERIKDQITSEDLIIIDEAHELFKYHTHKNHKKFRFKTISTLYNTNAHLLLMSGTPYGGLKHILNLNEIKINSHDTPSLIGIEYTSNSPIKEAVYFAKYCQSEYGPDHVNFIYIKNKSDCHKIKMAIQEENNCKIQIFTSDTKHNDFYEKFIKKGIIEEGTQFVICTNVIGTGTNIENDNIGEVLMFNSYDPVEIIQFSKRFRQKPNVKVNLINKFTGPIDKKIDVKNLQKQRGKFRQRQSNLLNKIEQVFYEIPETHTYDYLYYYHKFGTEKDIKNRIIFRSLVEEVRFIDEIKSTYNSPEALSKVLNSKSNIIVVDSQYYVKDLPEPKVNSESLKVYERNITDNFIDDLIKTPEDTLIKLSTTLNSYGQFEKKLIIKDFLSKNLSENTSEGSVDDELSQEDLSIIIDKVITPVNQSLDFFKDLNYVLYFIKKTEPNKRRRTNLELLFNSKFHMYYDVKLDPNSKMISLKLKDSIIESSIKGYDKTILDILKLTFDYCVDKDYIIYNEFKSYIESRFKIDHNTIDHFKDYPFNLKNIKSDKKGKILNISSTFSQALLSSIFIINTERNIITINGSRKSVYRFKSELSDSYLNNSKEKLQIIEYQIDESDFEYKYHISPDNNQDKQVPTKTILNKKFKRFKKIINNREYIIREVIGDDFFN